MYGVMTTMVTLYSKKFTEVPLGIFVSIRIGFVLTFHPVMCTLLHNAWFSDQAGSFYIGDSVRPVSKTIVKRQHGHIAEHKSICLSVSL